MAGCKRGRPAVPDAVLATRFVEVTRPNKVSQYQCVSCGKLGSRSSAYRHLNCKECPVAHADLVPLEYDHSHGEDRPYVDPARVAPHQKVHRVAEECETMEDLQVLYKTHTHTRDTPRLRDQGPLRLPPNCT